MSGMPVRMQRRPVPHARHSHRLQRSSPKPHWDISAAPAPQCYASITAAPWCPPSRLFLMALLSPAKTIRPNPTNNDWL